jgi:hypothetical protein
MVSFHQTIHLLVLQLKTGAAVLKFTGFVAGIGFLIIVVDDGSKVCL